MKIIIFTANKIIRDEITGLISNSIEKRNISSLSISNPSPVTLNELKLICNENVRCLIIADISNEEIYDGNWIEAIKTLSRNYNKIFFVLLSNKDEKATTIFKNKMRVLYFVNLLEENLEEELNRVIKSLSRNNRKIKRIYANDQWGNKVKILVDDVLFIETIKGTHKCMITHKKGVSVLRISISKFLNELDSRFVLCRPSTIANIDKVYKIDLYNNLLYFDTDIMCTFSRNNKKKIKSIFKAKHISK